MEQGCKGSQEKDISNSQLKQLVNIIQKPTSINLF